MFSINPDTLILRLPSLRTYSSNLSHDLATDKRRAYGLRFWGLAGMFCCTLPTTACVVFRLPCVEPFLPPLMFLLRLPGCPLFLLESKQGCLPAISRFCLHLPIPVLVVYAKRIGIRNEESLSLLIADTFLCYHNS